MRAALVLLALAGCTQHADGTCLWVPGDDGTCSGRGGGGGDSDPPPPRHVVYYKTALAPGHAIVLETGNTHPQLLHAPLDRRGLPTRELGPIAGENAGSVALWPGPDGTALLTMTTYTGSNPSTVTVVVDAAGKPSSQTTLTPASPELLQVVFDGEAYLVAWTEWFDGVRRFQLKRIWPDGRGEPARTAGQLGDFDVRGDLELATDGVGGAVLVWSVRVGGMQEPRTLRAVEIAGGEVVEPPRIIATDGEACLDERLSVVAARDGYHVLATRRRCRASDPAVLVDLRLDGTEQLSPLGFAAVPTDWIARRCTESAELPTTTPTRSCTDGFLATDGTQGWFVDGLLATATPSPWLTGATFHAATSTNTGYVAAFGHDDQVELVRIDPAADDRVTIAEGYYLPAEDGGCSTGGATSLAPVLALLLLRRRRAP